MHVVLGIGPWRFDSAHFGIFDFVWLVVEAVIASAVLRWAYVSVRHHWFSGPEETSTEDEDEGKDEDEDEDDEDEDEEDEEDEDDEDEEELILADKVFHVGALSSGRDRIVVAPDENEAIRIGARVLEVDEDDVSASEVYHEVVRKE